MLEFLTKFDFLNRIFRRGESRSSAKERLRLVLIHDRASVTPQVMESLKEDLISVISRYLEIDVTELEIGLEQKDGSIALAANIPIKKVRHTPLPRERVEAGLERRAVPVRSEPPASAGETGHVPSDVEPEGAAVSGADAEPTAGKKEDGSAPAGPARINAADRKKSGSRSKRRSKMKRMSELKKREASAEQEMTKGDKL